MSRYLRSIRKAQGRTQKDLSRASKVSQNQISKLEAGAVRMPSYATVKALAEALGVPPEEIRFTKPPKRDEAAA